MMHILETFARGETDIVNLVILYLLALWLALARLLPFPKLAQEAPVHLLHSKHLILRRAKLRLLLLLFLAQLLLQGEVFLEVLSTDMLELSEHGVAKQLGQARLILLDGLGMPRAKLAQAALGQSGHKDPRIEEICVVLGLATGQRNELAHEARARLTGRAIDSNIGAAAFFFCVFFCSTLAQRPSSVILRSKAGRIMSTDACTEPTTYYRARRRPGSPSSR